MSANPLVGHILAGTYRIECLLGKGGMGAVYAASHLRLPTRVAVKVLHAEAASNPDIFNRFRREAETASAIRHPNIVQVLDFNHLPDGTPYLIMEYLDGEDLNARLRERGRLSYPEVVTLVRAIGAGLSAAHKRDVVHRDLKPQNIFLSRHDQGDGVVEIPKIVDFGICRIRHTSDDSQHTRDQQLLGTPNFMSPEQARGQNSEVDHRTDQWALAAIVYQCLTGRLAFSGDSLAAIIYQVVLAEPPPLRSIAPEVPEHAEQAIMRALHKERDGRHPGVMDFVRAFCGHPSLASFKVGGRDKGPSGTVVLDDGGAQELPSGRSTPLPPSVPAGGTPQSLPESVRSISLGSLVKAGEQVASQVGPSAPGRRRALVYGGLLAGVASLTVLLYLMAPRAPASGSPDRPVATRDPAAAPARSGAPEPNADTVLLRVRPTPPDALVLIDGKRLGEDGSVRLPQGRTPLQVVVSAPGYRERRIPFTPERDGTLTIELGAEEPGREQGVPEQQAAKGRAERAQKPRKEAKRPPRSTRSDADDVDISGIR